MKLTVPRPALALALVLTTAGAAAQSANHDAVRKGGRGPVADESSRAVVTLRERDGKALVRNVGGSDNACVRGELPRASSNAAAPFPTAAISKELS